MSRPAVLLVSVLLSASMLRAETVLILPFFNASNSKNIDWVGDSISETILEALAGEGLDVVSPEVRDEMLRTMSVKRYALLTRASVMEIAVNLDASLALYGTFEHTPPAAGAPGRGSLKISAWIVDAKRVKRGESFNVTGPLEELSALQTNIAFESLRALSPGVNVTAEEFRRAHPPIRIDALESYVRGLLTTSLEQKNKLFANAARLEPGFSQPCYQLGRLNYIARNYRAAAEWYQKVAPADFHFRESLFFLGLSRHLSGDFKGAVQALRQVSDIVPLPEVMNNLGAALLRSGDLSAIDAFQKAIETDPADPIYLFNAGYVLWRRGEFAAATDRLRQSLERNPDDETATLLLGRCIKQQGPRPGDIRTEALERLKTEYNESAWLALKAMLAPKRK